jgi:dienelactone hydrolase
VAIDADLRDRDSEPLGLWCGEPAALEGRPDLRALAFEYASRGDRVPGRLLLPEAGSEPLPLVLLEHGAGGSRLAPYMLQVAAPWVAAGAAVASIDLPLHGERANTKLGHVLAAALSNGEPPNGDARLLTSEFLRQAVVDLQRLVDVAARLPRVDASRVAYAGLSLGSLVGAAYCAADTRPCAAAFALGGGGFGDPEIDPVHHVGRIAPRPLLFVNATRDETVSRSAAEALHAAAREPKQVLWFDAGHRDLPGRALAAMWGFLRLHLGVQRRS